MTGNWEDFADITRLEKFRKEHPNRVLSSTEEARVDKLMEDYFADPAVRAFAEKCPCGKDDFMASQKRQFKTQVWYENIIKATRYDIGLSQEYLAELAAVPVKVIQDWETGIEPDAEKKAMILQVLRKFEPDNAALK